MNWNEAFSKADCPSLEQIDRFIASPLWRELRGYLEETYAVFPVVEHSGCGGAPGWNVKYKKSGRSLCTLYPDKGCFTCLVTIGAREAMEAELLLTKATEYVRKVYETAGALNGSRWLMIRVESPAVLADVKTLIGTRVEPRDKL